MRTTTKDVKYDIDGEEMSFQLRKMNALDATYLMKFCLEKLLPLYKGLEDAFVTPDEDTTEADAEAIAAERASKFIEVIPAALASIEKDELIAFETMCLQNVYVLKDAGWQPVMVGKNIVISEIESDPMTVLLLCYEYVSFNLSGFFGGKGLGSILSRKNSSQQKA